MGSGGHGILDMTHDPIEGAGSIQKVERKIENKKFDRSPTCSAFSEGHSGKKTLDDGAGRRARPKRRGDEVTPCRVGYGGRDYGSRTKM